MTVKELIAILEGYPDDMPVKKYCYTGEYNDPHKAIEYVESTCEDHMGKEITETLIL